jgi:integral membrane sensor domain MASE1
VLTGSFFANLTIDGAVLASAVIAAGSSIQALAMAALVRRHVGVPYHFENIDQVVKFVLVAALGSTIAATLALPALYFLYRMPPSELLGNWSTWWQGDACGVLIFMPLILSWSDRSAGTRAASPRSRRSPCCCSARRRSCSMAAGRAPSWSCHSSSGRLSASASAA